MSVEKFLPDFNQERWPVLNNPVEQMKCDIDAMEEDVLKSSMKMLVKNNFLLYQYFGKEDIAVSYLLEGDYGSWKNPEIDRMLSHISELSSDWKKIINTHTRVVYNNIPLSASFSTPSVIQKDETSPVLDLVESNPSKEIEETDTSIKAKISEAFQNVSESVGDFFKTISDKIVDITNVPKDQLPLLKSILKAWQSMFDKLYQMWWTGNTIDCSGFVCKMFRLAGFFGRGEYLNSWALFKRFSKNKVTTASARAGDLIFWGNGGGGHVEMLVGTPYKKGGDWYVKTIGSSSDSIRVSPMYSPDGSVSKKQNGVAYRERKIKDKYQILRPQYGKPSEHQSKKKK